jgi:hypothetical protein
MFSQSKWGLKKVVLNENTNEEFSQKAKPVLAEAISSNPVNHSFLLQQTVAFEVRHFSSSLHVAPLEMSPKKKKETKIRKQVHCK